jgi:hypothetical protein
MGTIQSSETQTFAEYLRSQRTLTASQVATRTVLHDSHDLTASERAACLKGH